MDGGFVLGAVGRAVLDGGGIDELVLGAGLVRGAGPLAPEFLEGVDDPIAEGCEEVHGFGVGRWWRG